MALQNKIFVNLMSTCSNQPFTSSSCLRSQSASERTMVSWGVDEEEASPLLVVVTPEERGVSGIRVSSSILRSFWDEADLSIPCIYLICAQKPKHTSSWYFLSSSATSLCAFSHSSFSFSCSRWYFSCYHGNRHGKYSRELRLKKNPLKVRIFQQKKKKTRSTTTLKNKTLKGFLVWKFDIQRALYA